MAYNTFSLDILKQQFDLVVARDTNLFAAVPPVAISDLLRTTLDENVSLALDISTEKARSELIISPILLEIRRQMNRQIGFFSGVDFTVDPARGLQGVCDYVLSLSPERLIIEAPVVTVVEAKNENIKQGINQCIAELVAAQIFNHQRQQPIEVVYGAITTGNNWKFVQLRGTTVAIDSVEYYVGNVEKIVGIIVYMLKAAAATMRDRTESALSAGAAAPP